MLKFYPTLFSRPFRFNVVNSYDKLEINLKNLFEKRI
jgi:hypothetical protein